MNYSDSQLRRMLASVDAKEMAKRAQLTVYHVYHYEKTQKYKSFKPRHEAILKHYYLKLPEVDHSLLFPVLSGKEIAAFRKQLNWSQKQLAQETGLHHITISKIERSQENTVSEARMKITYCLRKKVKEKMQEM